MKGRKTFPFIFLAVIVLMATRAPAAAPPCPSGSVCVSWSAVTLGIDGKPVKLPVYYKIFRHAKATPAAARWVHQVTSPGVSAVLAAQPRGEQCYYLTAANSDGESAPTPSVCTIVRPAAPTGGSIELAKP
jgi:hypothetical protein